MKNKILKRLKEEFNNNPDLNIKEYHISLFKNIYVIYLETLCSSDKINDYVLKNLSFLTSTNTKINDLNNSMPGPNTIVDIKDDQIEFYITNGYTIIIEGTKLFAIETKGDLTRAVSPALMQQTLNGPQDAFTENYQSNLGQIKRRIKTSKLKTIEYILGRSTSTKIGINYIEGIADESVVKNIESQINKIDIDGILDSSILGHLIENESKSIFPTVKQTERPDIVAKSLLEGKIAIIVDTTPFVLILPAFFIDFINPISDTYLKSQNVKFLKFLRLLSFIISMMTPAIYIALINYNQETIPTSLLINFATQRINVPFPTIIEAVVMLVICEILRESDVRFPSSFGSSISVLGALILGEAAVSAGIVSPIMIIIISLTIISSLLFTEIELSNALRNYRFIFLIVASILGLYGIFIMSIIFFVNLLSITTINKPYFAPIMPFYKVYFNKTVNKKPDNKTTKRSKLTTDKNYTMGVFK